MNNRLSLPPTNTVRWSYYRKLAVLQAIERQEITEADACLLWSISAEELQSWRAGHAKTGVQGLKVTKRDRRAS